MEDLQKTEKELIAEQNKKVSEGLLFCIEYLSKIRGYFYSIKSLTSNLPLHINGFSPLLFLRAVKRIGLSGEIFKKPLQELTHSFLPCIIFLKDGGVCYIEKKTHEGFFVVHADHPKGEFVKQEQLEEIYEGHCILLKQLTDKSFQTYHSHWLWGTLHKMRSIYSSVLVASFFTNFLSVLIPLYAMNVYDRVLANNNYNTLWVLSVGIVIVIFFDFLLKVIKSHFVDTAGKNVDIVLSSSLFERILGLDLSKKQFTVGALASHVRELEVIREFCSSLSLLALVEIPFAIIFLIAVTYIGGMWFFIV